MSQVRPFYTLNSQKSSLVLDCRRHAPAILHWGIRLAPASTPEMLAQLTRRQQARASVSVEDEPLIALSPTYGAGFQGNAGIQVHRGGAAWAVYTEITEVQEPAPGSLVVVSTCQASELQVKHCLQLDEQSGVLVASTEVTNTGKTPLALEQCNAPCIPLPQHYDQLLGFEGRWAGEFQLRRTERFMGAYRRENRAGRTSHDTFPGIVIHTRQTNESIGGAYGLHLGWSGNHRISIEEEASGRAHAQLGELFYPGEMQLAPGESYKSPPLYGARTHDGFSGLSQRFHDYVRLHLTDARTAMRPRPVHFNTWEATYFDLATDRLCQLADQAAAIGAERFVLDDGWFRGRSTDKSGLGDWYVDEAKFPDGLGPLIAHVQKLGMEFGLWVEPEMVNPDSDLYRAHPDWALSADPAPRILFRSQLALDLTRPEVVDYLFARLDALLSEYPIGYLKWDMNRNLEQPGGVAGRAATHFQTLAVYGLLDKLRAAHPKVEIESCASGGARADYGVLAHTDRIWTSDTNDALDRLRIQKGFSFFFPAEFMGAHVGPRVCHVTGRTLSMETRAGVALFGHMGIEADLLAMDPQDKALLRDAIALHKEHRQLIMSGQLIRLDLPDYESGFGIIAEDGREALFSYALLASHPLSAPGRYRFRGLAADAQYRFRCIWPEAPDTPPDSAMALAEGQVFTGDALMRIGMQLPILKPESLLVFHLRSPGMPI